MIVLCNTNICPLSSKCFLQFFSFLKHFALINSGTVFIYCRWNLEMLYKEEVWAYISCVLLFLSSILDYYSLVPLANLKIQGRIYQVWKFFLYYAFIGSHCFGEVCTYTCVHYKKSTVWFADLLVFCSGNKSTTFASRKRRCHNTGHSFYLFLSLFPVAIGATYFTLTISSSQYLFCFILNTLTIAGWTEGCWYWKQNNRKISYWWGPWEYDLFFFFLHKTQH